MKIAFDIKHRDKIESGEYKVIYVENSSMEQYPVEILKWDSNSDAGCIIGCIRRNGKDRIYVFEENGEHKVSKVSGEDNRLFIVTPEPEMSEMEISLLSWLSDDTSGEIPMERMKQVVKAREAELLDLAKQQLLQSGELLTQEHHEKLMETLREECKKDLPRWRQVEADKEYPGCVARYMDINGDWNYCMSSGKVSDDCEYISFASLERLPKDEDHE